MKILVADDNAAVLKGVSLSIRDMGYEVLEADNGYGAMRILEENEVDILLTDMEMPGMYGDELIKYVRKLRLPTKTILMSGHPRGKQFAAECGADAYIQKGGLMSWSERIVAGVFHLQLLIKLFSCYLRLTKN